MPNWTTTVSCTPGYEGGTDSGIGNMNTVDIGAGKSVTCTYTNTMVQTLTSTDSNYVRLVSGGGPNNPHKAVFQFTGSVNAADIKPTNIIYCVRSASAVAQSAGYSNPNCNDIFPSGSQWGSVSQTSVANGFSLNYNSNTATLEISDVNTSNSSLGSFYIGCASCTASIKFTGIHNSAGVLFPDKIIQVY